MQSTLDQLNQHWQESDVISNKGLSADEIEFIEGSFSAYFSKEFKEYLTRINGMEEGEADPNLFYFWGHQIIQDEFKNSIKIGEGSIFIGFADRIVIESIYMTEMTSKPQNESRVAIKKNNFKIISPSFKRFIAEYQNDIDSKLTDWETKNEEDKIAYSLYRV